MSTERTSIEVLQSVAHRPFPLPNGPWSMTQRWSDLLFAHWPMPAATITALLPAGLEIDTFDGAAWLGVVPFWMDRIEIQLPGGRDRRATIPSVTSFSELNLRTYVRSRLTGNAGVFFFSLDAASPLAVIGARTLFHLPYFFASMKRTTSADRTVRYQSKRLFTRENVEFDAVYRGLGRPPHALASQPGTIEHFLTERYCLFTSFHGKILTGNVHHKPWSLEAAEADFRFNQLTAPHGFSLPDRPPLLHFSAALEVFIWPLQADGSV